MLVQANANLTSQVRQTTGHLEPAQFSDRLWGPYLLTGCNVWLRSSSDKSDALVTSGPGEMNLGVGSQKYIYKKSKPTGHQRPASTAALTD